MSYSAWTVRGGVHHFLRWVQIGYNSANVTENSFTFIESAEVVHGQKNITAMHVSPDGVPC